MAYMGETRIFAFLERQPSGWLPCKGQLLPIDDHEALFDVIGTKYGGDGTANFALPNLAGPSSDGTPLQLCISLYGERPTGR